MIFNFFFPTELASALKTVSLTPLNFPTYKTSSDLLAKVKSEELNFDERVIVYRQCANNTLFPYIQFQSAIVCSVLVREAKKKNATEG